MNANLLDLQEDMASVRLGMGADLIHASAAGQEDRDGNPLDQQRGSLKQAHRLQTRDGAGGWGKS